jgi:hypothetical protein
MSDPIKKTAEQRKLMAKKIVESARKRAKNKEYVDVPDDIKNTKWSKENGAYSCIGGVCQIYKDAGAIDKVDWSNTSFSKNAKEYGFENNGYGLRGLKNLEPGDILQRAERNNSEGNYYPNHSQIFLGVNEETGEYEFFDNYAGLAGGEGIKSYSKDEIENLVNPSKKRNEQHASIYKINPYNAELNQRDPEVEKILAERNQDVEREISKKSGYNWDIKPDAKNYNEKTSRVMNAFVRMANDENVINDLVKKTGKSKSEINDSLLNVFGIMGQENDWTTSKGKGLGSRLENIGESVLTAFGLGEKRSVGPGQIKYSELSDDLKEKFDIKSPNDLYNVNKAIPLMTAMDLKDKKTLSNWGDKNVLSDKLFGFTTKEGFKADDLHPEGGSALNNYGRYSPYLRNQYSSIRNKTITTGKNDIIPFNEETKPNVNGEVQYKIDPSSYADKIRTGWVDNLTRTFDNEKPIELPEAVIPQKQQTEFKYGGNLHNCNYCNKTKQFSKGGWLDAGDPPVKKNQFKEVATTTQDNINPSKYIPLKREKINYEVDESLNQTADSKELKTTGRIQKPRSILYKSKKKENDSNKTVITEDNRTVVKRNEDHNYRNKINNQPLNITDRGLVALSNPTTVLGDLGVSGARTSENIRKNIMTDRYNPSTPAGYKTAKTLQKGLDMTQDALMNVAALELGAFLPGSGAYTGAAKTLLNEGAIANVTGNLMSLTRTDWNKASKGDVDTSNDIILNIVDTALRTGNLDITDAVTKVKNFKNLNPNDKKDLIIDLVRDISSGGMILNDQYKNAESTMNAKYLGGWLNNYN